MNSQSNIPINTVAM